MRIEIAEYDTCWPIQFGCEAMRIRSALGAAVLGIEHVGSTSVPGLAAKPVIDVNLVVADSTREEIYARPLEAIGYHLIIREPHWFEHRMFTAAAPKVNLHVFSVDCPEVERVRLFRDWLRESAEDRARYAIAKRKLAQQEWQRVQDYADAKQGVINDIMARAHVWSANRSSR